MFGMLGGIKMDSLGKSPREYNYAEFWTSTWCPNCKVASFPFIIWMVNTAIYLASYITMYFFGYQPYTLIFLGSPPEWLNVCQAMNPYQVRYGYQLWRPLTSLFLTAGFQEYAFQSAYLLLFGYMFSATKMSNLNMLIFYLACGYVGNIFGAACDNTYSLFVGSTPSSFGMFGAMISTLCVNWHALDSLPQMKCPLILTMVIFFMLLLFNGLSGLNNSLWNLFKYHPHQVWASWGGFLCGLFLGLIMVPRARRCDEGPNSYGRLCTYIGSGLMVTYLGILLPLFFTVFDPILYF